jgi:hypothetical protein
VAEVCGCKRASAIERVCAHESERVVYGVHDWERRRVVERVLRDVGG